MARLECSPSESHSPGIPTNPLHAKLRADANPRLASDGCTLALPLVPFGASSALHCGRCGKAPSARIGVAVWLPAGGAGSGSTGHGGRLVDDPLPRKRIFAVFWLVKQWVASAIWPGLGRAAWPVSTHAPGRQPHRRPMRLRPRRADGQREPLRAKGAFPPPPRWQLRAKLLPCGTLADQMGAGVSRD